MVSRLRARASVVGEASLDLSKLKDFINDFPSHGANTIVGLSLIVGTGIVIMYRMSTGADFPAGYDPWLIFLASLAGFSTVGMAAKRFTAVEYAAAKNPGNSVPSPVTVEGAATVNVGEAKVETPSVTSETLPTSSETPPG